MDNEKLEILLRGLGLLLCLLVAILFLVSLEQDMKVQHCKKIENLALRDTCIAQILQIKKD